MKPHLLPSHVGRCLCAGVLLLLCQLPSFATTFHVTSVGDDASDGLTVATAWATLQHAADLALAGDSVIVHSGSYQGFAAMDHSGAASEPIVFTALGSSVLIDQPCSYNNLDGINVENVNWVEVIGFRVEGMPRTGIRTALSDHVSLAWNICRDNGKWGILTGFAEHCLIENNTCSGSIDEHGIYFSNSADDPIIRYNHCYDNNANGIHMNGDVSLGGDGVIGNAQVYGNIIHGNGVAGGSGINCDGVINSVFFNNLLYDNHASGISLYQIDGGAPSTGNKVYNNTILNAADARWCVNITELCTGNQLLNNILINQHPWRGSIVIAQDALPGFISDHNIVINALSPDGDATILDLTAWQALGYDANSQVANPLAVLFQDPFGGDFQAPNAASQQVDAGTAAVSAIVTVDPEGTPRPMGAAYDVGCHELGISTAIPEITAGTTAFVLDGRLYLPDALPGDRITIADVIGKRVMAARTETSPCVVVLPPAASGSLVYQVVRADGKIRSAGVVWH